MVMKWQWAAYGKHPVSRDFIRCNKGFPLVRSFSDWVEKGYQALVSENKTHQGPISWRFWAKGAGKKGFVCGILKDSCDRLGRYYPLLIMGTGLLEGWEKQWDLLPFACEVTWNQIEYISVQNYNDISKFEVEIQNIRPPAPEWSEFRAKRDDSLKLVVSSNDNNLFQYVNDVKNRVVSLSKKTECFIFLDDKLLIDKSVLISYWYFHLKPYIKIIPNIIFMGGSLEKSHMALFKRPLAPADFVGLSSLSILER